MYTPSFYRHRPSQIGDNVRKMGPPQNVFENYKTGAGSKFGKVNQGITTTHLCFKAYLLTYHK